MVSYRIFIFILFSILLQSCKVSESHRSTVVDAGIVVSDTSPAIESISSSADSNKALSDSRVAETLPDVLFYWPMVSNRIAAAGISDPGIAEDVALRMSVIRALVVAGLLNNSVVHNVTETYYRELPGRQLSTTRFNSLSKINATIRFDTTDIVLADQHITSAGEKIVLITADSSLFNLGLTCDRVYINAEVYYSETPVSLHNRIYMYFKIKAEKITGNGETVPLLKWELHSDNNRIEFRSEFEGKEVYFPIRYHRYAASATFIAEDTPDAEIFLGSTMGYGIWNAFAVSMLRQIDMLDKDNVEVKSMMDDYSGRFETMSRELSVTQGSHRIHSAVVYENGYYLRIEQLTQ